ncbi:MAG: ABC transporter substrate-binding protein [Streptosporangiales bacterium]|nr:ABC transporter substrate-binding protein [Streptosporangiales bacterium]
MRNRPFPRIGVSVLAAVLALGACGTRSEETGATTTLKIGFDAPTTGQLSAVGLGMQHSAEMAVKEANAKNLVPGVKFELVPKDDQATPSIGQQNASAFVADQDVVGVVGAYNSSVSQSMQPTTASANLLQISGANTNPTLTRGAKHKDAPKRPYKNYFRTVTTDAKEAPAVARYAYNELKLKEVATVNDGKVYGLGVIEEFTHEFEKLGGKIVVKQQISDKDTDYSAVVSNIKSSSAQALMYGGEYPQAGPLAKQLKAAGKDIPLLGNDAVYDDEFIALAGDAAEGAYVVTAAEPIGNSQVQQKFVTDYKAASHKEPYGIFGPYVYDATMAIINSVAAVAKAGDGKLPEKPELRAKVTEAAQNVAFDGLTGKIAFDEFGDNKNYSVTMNTVKDGKWSVVGPVG